MFSYTYAYLLGPFFILFPVWLIFFWYRKDLRREMLLMSFFIAALSPFSEFLFLVDYWRPETFYSWPTISSWRWPVLEDFLFGFYWGGITAVLYEVCYGAHYAKRHDRRNHWHWFLLPLGAIFLILFIAPYKFFGINSIYTAMAACIGVFLFIMVYRRDLFRDAVASGFLFAIFMFSGYLIFLVMYPEAIHRWWLLQNISEILVLGVPIEEVLLALTWGLAIGPLYEFIAGFRLQS